MKNPWVIIGVVTAVLFGGAIWYSGKAAEGSNVGIEIKENIKGNLEAEVTLVEYSDLQCPSCANVHPVLVGLLEEHGDNLRFEYKHFPIPSHTYAIQAAVAAEAAGQQDKFFEYHDKLFENQQTWSAGGAPKLFFIQYAEELGLDVDMFRRQMESSVLRDKVLSEMEDGKKLDVSGTPTFFLNGQKMLFTTYQSFLEQVAVAIDPSLSSSTSTTDTSGSGGVKFGI